MASNPRPASILPDTLDAWEYLASYEDLLAFYGPDNALAANHYNVQGGPIEGRSITFNAWAYLASYQDLMNYFGFDVEGAAWHYVLTGHPVEGRVITFDTLAYLKANADLQTAFGNDLDGGLSNAARHYVLAGKSEVAAGLRSSGQGQTFVLTAGPDVFPDDLDNSGDDIIIAENDTLGRGDNIDGGEGSNDTLRYNADNDAWGTNSLFVMDGVERLEVSVEKGSFVGFNLSNTTDIESLAFIDSRGDVSFSMVPTLPLSIDIQSVTEGGDIVVLVQDAAIIGGSDSIDLNLMNNYGNGIGTLTIGGMSDRNKGVEIVDMMISQASSTIQRFDVDITNLHFSGDQDLTIVSPLNGLETIVDASLMTGNLSLNLTNNSTTGVSYTGSQGKDTISFAGTTGNHTINTGAGDDSLVAGRGSEIIHLGDGNDRLEVDVRWLNALDGYDGGDGVDTLLLAGPGNIEQSVANKLQNFENYVMSFANSVFSVAGSMLDSITGSARRLSIDMGWGFGNTVDITDVTFDSNNRLSISGSSGDDLVIANDATVNANTTIMFGNGSSDLNDTLRIVDAATITIDDLQNISGLDVIELVTDSVQPQTWNISVSAAVINAGGLIVSVGRNVVPGSNINIDAGDTGVTVYTYSYVPVNVVAGAVTVQVALEFSDYQDSLYGTSANNVFTAMSLDQIGSTDIADGNGGEDLLVVDFAVNDGDRTLESLFNNANIRNIDELEFNTSNDVSFQANRTGFGADTTPGGDFDFDVFTLGSGDDMIVFGGSTAIAYTVNGNGGDDVVQDNYDWTGDGVLDGADTDITFNGGNDDDNFIFNDRDMLTGADFYAPGEGTDTVTINDDGVLIRLFANDIADLVNDGELEIVSLNGVDDIDLWVNSADLYDFSGGTAIFNLDSHDDIFFSAASVTDAGESVNVTVYTGGNGLTGNALVVGGPGNDTIHNIQAATFGTGVDHRIDSGGILGLRGGDTIILPDERRGDYVVYKTPQDGGSEGENGGIGVQDIVQNFDIRDDFIVFSKSTIGGGAGNYTTVSETGSGWMGDSMDKNGDDVVDAVTDPVGVIDLNVVELAVFTGTGLSDADLLDLSTIAGFINGTGLTSDIAGSQVVFSVQGSNDTGLYSFESDSANGDVEDIELSLMAVVDNAMLDAGNFLYA